MIHIYTLLLLATISLLIIFPLVKNPTEHLDFTTKTAVLAAAGHVLIDEFEIHSSGVLLLEFCSEFPEKMWPAT